MITLDVFAASSIVWPLTFLLFGLLVLRKVEHEVKPIVSGMIGGLAVQSSRNAATWAMAMLMASAASCQALGEVATDLGWNYAAAAAKVLQPGLVAVIAFIMRSPAQEAEKTKTAAPFTTQQPKP